MKRKRTVLLFAATVIAGVIFSVEQVRADVYMKSKVHTSAYQMSGRSEPATDAVIITWLTKDKARMDHDDGTSWLFHGDEGIFYRIDHNKREYSVLRLNFKIQLQRAPGGDPGKAKSAGKMQLMNLSAKVTKTKETKMIGAWNCRKYIVKTSMGMAGTTTYESWATEDIKIDYAMAFAMTHAMLSVMSGFENYLKEMRKVQGIVVYETSKSKTFGGETGTTTKELVECAETAAPAGTYDIPAGYKKVD
jgi:hypothetical protein